MNWTWKCKACVRRGKRVNGHEYMPCKLKICNFEMIKNYEDVDKPIKRRYTRRRKNRGGYSTHERRK